MIHPYIVHSHNVIRVIAGKGINLTNAVFFPEVKWGS